jgi:hypothetical protein
MLNTSEKKQSTRESKIHIDWNRTKESPKRNIKNHGKKSVYANKGSDTVASKLIYTVINVVVLKKEDLNQKYEDILKIIRSMYEQKWCKEQRWV